jgi:uncharacterized membrane protein YhaH (DUF805 family)
MALMFEPFRKYATFSGRARRREYWGFLLLLTIVATLLTLWLFAALGWQSAAGTPEEFEAMVSAGGPAMWALGALSIFYLFTIIPSLAVSVRRLHDSDKSGWWLLLNLVPAGALVLFIFYLLDGTSGPNRHGPDPKGRPAPDYS